MGSRWRGERAVLPRLILPKLTIRAFHASRLPRRGIGVSPPRLDLALAGNTLRQNNKRFGSDVMKFGIFYELQLPRPWQAGDELKLYQDALTQLETADRLGYDYAWVVEHHFLEEYSHSPSPESFLAAASQRTKNIRLGHGIFQLTTNHPARVAERVAVLDLLSQGRVEFGMGESASITELTPFGRDMETKKEVFEEAVRAIFPMFKQGGSEHHGKYFDIPLRNVVPKPVQKPAVVDGVLAAADHRARRPERFWPARF